VLDKASRTLCSYLGLPVRLAYCTHTHTVSTSDQTSLTSRTVELCTSIKGDGATKVLVLGLPKRQV